MALARLIFLCLFLCFSCSKNAKDTDTEPKTTEANLFWNTLKTHCGQSFEGVLELPIDDEDFKGKRLIMHVKLCEDNRIKIPFFVGDDKSRTWILTLKDNRIELKHDHRHKDGTEDSITMYGGTSTNSGQETIQLFSADQHTKTIIPAASTNVWWITLDETTFTYNLRRLGTERVFRVTFDLTKTVETPEDPWGWND